ncbi:hypothetical protein C1H76_2516 [Elsinoe australis]|uniref:Uncharacterized protein n=1 Tax=Elsinoe australis TaxID=40998 RepID=A0A4U7B267_9PEZI|nr:hypothetical protein C1H76_2516 [Elsinoe australis]
METSAKDSGSFYLIQATDGVSQDTALKFARKSDPLAATPYSDCCLANDRVDLSDHDGEALDTDSTQSA